MRCGSNYDDACNNEDIKLCPSGTDGDCAVYGTRNKCFAGFDASSCPGAGSNDDGSSGGGSTGGGSTGN